MKRTVRLYGVLRQHFGRDFPLELSSPAEGINALCYLLPGFERFLRNAQGRGLVFSVFAGPRNLTEHDLLLNTADDSPIRIVPLIAGSKNAGLFQTILGIALVAIGYFSFGATSPWGMGLIAAGTGAAGGEGARLGRKHGSQTFLTQHTGLPPRTAGAAKSAVINRQPARAFTQGSPCGSGKRRGGR